MSRRSEAIRPVSRPRLVRAAAAPPPRSVTPCGYAHSAVTSSRLTTAASRVELRHHPGVVGTRCARAGDGVAADRGIGGAMVMNVLLRRIRDCGMRRLSAGKAGVTWDG